MVGCRFAFVTRIGAQKAIGKPLREEREQKMGPRARDDGSGSCEQRVNGRLRLRKSGNLLWTGWGEVPPREAAVGQPGPAGISAELLGSGRNSRRWIRTPKRERVRPGGDLLGGVVDSHPVDDCIYRTRQAFQ